MQTSLCPYCLKMVQTDTCPYCGCDVNYCGYPNHLPVGFTLNGRNPYVIGAARGQGGFGITYIALDTVTNQRVAVKEYYPTHCCGRNNSTYVYPSYGQEATFSKGKGHFLEEAQILHSLSDINSIVRVMDFFESNNTAYLVMEFLDGSSLKDYVSHQGKLSASIFLQQMKPLMEDIARMHLRGVIHRDIAPDNIIMLADGSLKLIDFGAARFFSGDSSMTVVVKKGFAPIEQYMRNGSNICTDVYALAATMYYCLTGEIPPDSAERQYGESELIAPSALGADLTSIQEYALEKALELQPKDRLQSVDALLDMIFAKTPTIGGQQIIYDVQNHELQENCPVIAERLQLVYDYDRNTAIIRPALRSLTDSSLQSVTAEFWCAVSGDTAAPIARFDIPCEKIKRNEFFGKECPVALPLGELRDVRLQIVSVTQTDGIQILCGSNCETIAEQEPLKNYFHNDAELLQQYKQETSANAVWKPVAGAYYWNCSCGCLNLSAEAVCSRCGMEKEIQFASLDMEKLEEAVIAKKEEEVRIKRELERIKAEEVRLRRALRKEKIQKITQKLPFRF